MSQTTTAASGSQRRVLATPLARAVAADLGVDLASVTGSGRAGRILRADVEAAAAAGAAPAGAVDNHAHPTFRSATLPDGGPHTAAGGRAAPAGGGAAPAGGGAAPAGGGVAPGVGSAQAVPHFFLTIRVDAEALLGFRAELNRQLAAGGQDLEVSFNDLVVKACANLLRASPELNVSFAGDRLLRHRRVNVGIAVAVDGGQIVPVVRDADRKRLTQVAREARDLIGRARAGQLAAGEASGATFTVSDLGRHGVEQFRAQINPPEAAILAVGAPAPAPVVAPDGQVEVHQLLRLTLSIDHRALDGATGAGFLAQLKDTLEHPLRIVA